jgi:hypothetical protein
MTTPITLPQQDEPTQTELRRRYEASPDAETRTRYQMLSCGALPQAELERSRLLGKPNYRA